MADTTKVLFGRDFKLYTVPYHSSVTPPADTVAYGTAWGTPAGQTGAWVDSGYTDGGLNFSAEITRGEIRVDQEIDPIFRPATGRNMTMDATLSEFIAANIKAATGQGTITTVAAGSGTRGHDDLDIIGTISDIYLAVGFDIKHPGDLEAFRVFGWRTLPTAGFRGTINPNDKAGIAFAATLLPDSANSGRVMKVRDLIAALP